MAGTASKMDKAMESVESQLRKYSNTPKGQMSVKRIHVSKILHGKTGHEVIGKPRGDVVWACVAGLLRPKTHKNKDMVLSEENMVLLQAKGLAALGEGPAAVANMHEMMGSVRNWLEENEETNVAGTYVIRPGKLKQLKDARKMTYSTRGGPNAILAAVVLLGTGEKATLMRPPNKSQNKGAWVEWIPDMVQWMTGEGWINATQAEDVLKNARQTAKKHAQENEPTMRVLNLGEGWRSVGRHIMDLVQGAHVTGADRRGFTYTGTAMGHIISEINHDWSEQKSDLITALSKKAGVSVRGWNLITLEPECTIFSRANAMNQAGGSAHGKYAKTALNMENSTLQRQEEEAERYRTAKAGVKLQLESLERHPNIPFLVENPADSELWELDEVKAILSRQEGWVKRVIDRCAYGRGEKKPTIILTNILSWTPKGTTRNGRCKAGRCTGHRTDSGKTSHPSQTVANSKDKQVDKGAKTGGRYEWTTKAVVNSLERMLLQEIIEAL